MKVPFNSFGFSKCSNPKRCKCCSYANTNHLLSNKINLPLEIPCKSTCESKNIVYILQCTKCNVFYVGESSRSFRIRFLEHIYRIKYLKSNLSNISLIEKFNENNVNCKILYNHFAFNHEIESDLKFQIFATNLTTFRKRLETVLMYLLNSIHPNGLNHGPSFTINTIENYSLVI